MIIELHLKSIDDLTNEFNDKELNSSLGEYIFNKALISKLNKKKNLEIKITTDFEVSESDKESIVDMIRSYYGNLVKIELIYLGINNSQSIILSFAGILVLFIAYFFSNFVIHEIFIIIGWLAIWEAGYSLMFSNRKHKRRNQILKKLTNCYIKIN